MDGRHAPLFGELSQKIAMNTTLLFAELLIVGLQASVWLFLLALVVFGTNWLQALSAFGLADWQTVIVVIGLSIVYVLGIIIDRLADLIFAGWDKKLRERIFPNAPLSIGVMRFQLGKDNEYLNRQFEYTRSRMRISRASILNFILMTIFGVVLIAQLQFPTYAEKAKYLIAALAVGVFLSVSAIYTWNKLTQTFIGLVKANWDLMLSEKNERKEKSVAGDTKRKTVSKSKAG